MKTGMTRLVLLLAIALVAAGPAQAAPSTELEFLGQQIFPTSTQFQGTTFGGLSSIAYDESRGVFYVLSDDQVNARFYTLRIGVASGAPAVADRRRDDAARRRRPAVRAAQPRSGRAGADEGRHARDHLRGLREPADRPVGARVRARRAPARRRCRLPSAFLPNAAGTRGVRQNLGFESAATPPNGRFLFTATENALVQDGPPATVAAGSPARLLRYNLQRGELDRQYVYWTDPIAEPPVPANQFAVNGLVELLPLNNQFLLAMERSFSVGAPGTGNTIKLYDVALPGADDVNGFDSLATLLAGIQPVEKTLLLDLDALGIPLDNVEGMTFGPDLPDGRRSLILVSDNNFSPAAFTQFLLFAAS